MLACMCACYICMHARVRDFVLLMCMHVYARVCMHVGIHIVYAYMHVHDFLFMCMHVHACMYFDFSQVHPVCLYICIYYMHVCERICIHACRYVRMCSFLVMHAHAYT
jgi:hypothetical protein